MQAPHPCSACTKLCVIALSAYNKAYPRRSEYLTWASPHCGKRPPQRRVSKTLYDILLNLKKYRHPWRSNKNICEEIIYGFIRKQIKNIKLSSTDSILE
jgi:hypothetical protein